MRLASLTIVHDQGSVNFTDGHQQRDADYGMLLLEDRRIAGQRFFESFVKSGLANAEIVDYCFEDSCEHQRCVFKSDLCRVERLLHGAVFFAPEKT